MFPIVNLFKWRVHYKNSTNFAFPYLQLVTIFSVWFCFDIVRSKYVLFLSLSTFKKFNIQCNRKYYQNIMAENLKAYNTETQKLLLLQQLQLGICECVEQLILLYILILTGSIEWAYV